ncbi:hypothetical protein OIU84_001797 [Salix udensis]|uniref:C3HC-type domain-containing protein n=1 Tax=Salix udensis TaxID=889485 RepID=A0AAD6KA45_9ROSI|nr:hypothetical protein OIU84_001797 [Salix udensis]
MFSVEKGASVFSLKLDNGHKLSCPWIENACDEILAEFAPTPPQLLVDKFREHSCALLRLSAPQMISSSAIEYVRCHQLEEFLRQSPKLENGNGSANLSQIQFFVNDSDADSANLYYKAQKLASLCGWKPRALPCVVECKDRSAQLFKDLDVRDSYHMVINGQNPSIRVYSVASEQSVEANEESVTCSGRHADPNGDAIDYKLCGASVGLWTFSMVPQPLELFRFH